MSMSDAFLNEIRDFLRRSGMSSSYFGKVACGNSELVTRLENGGSVTLRTAERVREYIASHTVEAAQ